MTPFTHKYGYDKNGNVTSTKYPSGRLITYNYANDKVTGILNNGASIASNIGYKAFGRFNALTFGNAIKQTTRYDQQYRIRGITATGAQNLIYTYDTNDNITGITDSLDNAKNKSYGYDSLDRLTLAIGPWGSVAYTYDGVGNRKTENTQTGNTSYTYTQNKLMTATGEKYYSFGYDQNGNTNQENSRTYIYNQNQRLIKITEQTTVKDEQGQDIQVTVTKGEYVYNGNGQRVRNSGNGQTTYFVYDQQGKLIAESGDTNVDYVLLNGNPLAILKGQTTYYIHTDHQSTPQKMTDSQQQIAWEISDMPFGETINIYGSVTNNIRFPGQYKNDETGLYYNYYRDYKSETGRYIQSDPIGIQKGSNHLFVYAFNKPSKYIDPTGLLSGNVLLLKPELQDGECSLEKFGAPINSAANNNSCIKDCCKKHDDCYATYGCNQTSWLGPLISPLILGPCTVCNAKVAACITPFFVKDCKKPRCPAPDSHFGNA